MKKLRTLLILGIVLSFCFSACKDDEEHTPGTTPTEDIIRIQTSFGDMYIWLYKDTPIHRDNFLKLTGEDFFDSTTFHRIVTNFVIQGGDPNSKDNDPNNDGQGGPGYTLQAEIDSSHLHKYGAVGAARLPDSANPDRESSGSQFYIVLNQNGTPFLDYQYTVFGEVISGMDVAEAIVSQPEQGPPSNRPTTDIPMQVDVLQKSLVELKDEFDFEP